MHSGNALPSPPPADPSSDTLLFDFDGTLVPIADHPQAVTVTPALRTLLLSVAARFCGRFALVSGRSLDDLGRLFGPLPFAAAGSHGSELQLPDGSIARPERPAALDRVAVAVDQLARRTPGVEVENKRFGVAVHYRLAPQAAGPVQELTAALAAAEGLKLQPGKMVFELTMPGADKGTAITTLMAQSPFRGTRPMFFGDDLTDEAGFAAAAMLSGGGVLVGPARPTRARFGLPGVPAVHAWLEQQGE
jgi:trehalose 6-phosphate phosphatase